MRVKKVSKPALHADTYSVACVVNNNAEVLESALNRIKELEKRLGKEKIEPCDKVRTEIEAQEQWLAEAGYNAYNVGIAFSAIKHALGK